MVDEGFVFEEVSTVEGMALESAMVDEGLLMEA